MTGKLDRALHNGLVTLALVGLSVLAVAEMIMSGYFGATQGRLEIEKYLYGAGFAANEVVKWTLIFILGRAVARRRYGAAVIGGMMLLPAVLFISGSAHLGFVGLVRGDTAASRTIAKVTADDAAAVIKADQAQLDQMRANRKWAGTRQCTNPTVETSIAFCAEYRAVEKRLTEARSSLKTASAVGLADPQSEVLGWLFPTWSERSRQLVLALLTGLSISVISFVGFFVVGHASVPKLEQQIDSLKETAAKLREGDEADLPALGRRTLQSPEEIEAERIGITGAPTLVAAVRGGIIEHPGVKHVIAWLQDRVDHEDGGKVHVTAAYTDYQTWAASQSSELTREPLPVNTFWSLVMQCTRVALDRKHITHAKLRYVAANDQRGVA